MDAQIDDSGEATLGTRRAPAGCVPLEDEIRIAVDTATAAFHLGRQPQTLRCWAMRGAPISPIRVNGRLLWRVSDLKRALGVEAA